MTQVDPSAPKPRFWSRPDVRRDMVGVAGVVSVSVGAGMAYLPAGPIVGGVFLIAAAVLMARMTP